MYPSKGGKYIIAKSPSYIQRDFSIDIAGAGNNLRISFGESGRNGYLNLNSGLNLDEWNHLIVIYDSTNDVPSDRIRVYVDGIRRIGYSYKKWPREDSRLNFKSIRPLGIGAVNVGTRPVAFFVGMIDDIGIYDRALDDQEINVLYEGK